VHRSASALLLGLLAQVLTLALSAGAAEPAADTQLFADRPDGVSCSFYDVGLALPWPRGRVAHLDRAGRVDGNSPYAALVLDPSASQRVLRLDVLPLVQSWWRSPRPGGSLLLRSTAEPLRLVAREDGDPALRPQLRLQTASGVVRYVEPVADAALDCSTFRGLGTQPVLNLHRGSSGAMRFDLAAAVAALGPQPPLRAELVLVRAADDRMGRGTLEVNALTSPTGDAGPPPPAGLAERYPADAGITSDPDVVFADGFESTVPNPRWNLGMPSLARSVASDPTPGFRPLSGRALRVQIPRGDQVGLDWRLRLKDQSGREPEELYFRYCLLLAPSWLLTRDGGKLPGLAGTYGRAGWGGRAWDGQSGWSLRGSYGLPVASPHPAQGQVMLGTYAYHAGSEGRYGEGLPWMGARLAGLVSPGRWHCIEQHLRLNTPGKGDGLLEVWVDGRPAFRRDDLRLRDRAELRIEEVWMNVFHGGTAVANADMHAWIDNVVVARRYIGLPSALPELSGLVPSHSSSSGVPTERR